VETAVLEAIATLVPVFAGVPRAIEGLATCHAQRAPASHQTLYPPVVGHVAPPVMHSVWKEQLAQDPLWGRPAVAAIQAAGPPSSEDVESSSIRRIRATATLGAIYTSQTAPLEAELGRLHPRLHHFIWHDGYGYAMASHVLVLVEVEAVAVGILTGLNAPRQLQSHLRGALAVGLPTDFITELLEHAFEHIWMDEGIHAESKEMWREILRRQRAKAAAAAGVAQTVASLAEARAEEQFQDAIAKSRRMAAHGQTHPLYRAGQMLGSGEFDVDEEEAEEVTARKKNAATSATDESRSSPAAARSFPAQPARSGNESEDAPSLSSAPEVSDEDVQLTIRAMMARRARAAAAEVQARKDAGSPTPAPVRAVDDAWPVPPHVLDPSGMGALPPGASGIHSMGLRTPASGGMDFPGGQLGGIGPGMMQGIRSRL
jgi:hypothetical protein